MDIDEKIKRERKIFFIIIPAILIIALIGISFAFFNYTRTGSSNVIKVGRISFITRQTETINLVNVFPIDKTNVDTDTDNVDEVVIEIEGDTDYADGIEYLVSSVNSNIYTTSGMLVPISLDVTTSGLGNNNDNYWTARESKDTVMYKKLVGDTLVGDQMLLVGYIPKNTTSGQAEGVDGSITIKAYFDKDKIKISDTYDGTESDNMGSTNEWAEGKTVITTSEWNVLQQNGVSFKIKVEANEGIWVNPSLEEIMKRDNIGIDIQNGVDFSKTSDKDGLNGEGTKGVYMLSSTQNDTNPVLYYRGDVKDNNVLFAGYCWKAIRTTDTGGIKMIYNGEPNHEGYEYRKIKKFDYINYDNSDSTISIYFNVWDRKWTGTANKDGIINIKFSLEDGDYIIHYTSSSASHSTLEMNGTVLQGTDEQLDSYIELNNVLSADQFEFNHQGVNGVSATIDLYIEKKHELSDGGCNNESNSQITVNQTNKFHYNNYANSIAYVGYMYGDVYEIKSWWFNGVYYSNSFIWDGEKYSLSDDAALNVNGNRHYTCGLSDKNEKCETIRYYYDSTEYINLSNGESLEDAMKKMKKSEHDSVAKVNIDSWFSTNMTQYINRLEDTIFCNDRTVESTTGWNPNGGSISSSYVHYDAFNRFQNGTPTLSCPKSDSFTVSNSKGNMGLTYPVALLSSDEFSLAGFTGLSDTNKNYLISDTIYWGMSPFSHSMSYQNVSDLSTGYGGLTFGSVHDSEFALRPIISIKPGQLISKGTGTASNPYVIE